jgi:phage terminase small subunit
MGKRGPKPTPTAILEKRGSWRAKERTAEPETVPFRDVPECPQGLTGDAAAVWREDAPRMVGIGTLTAEDLRAFERYCRQFALWRKLMAQVEAAEIVEETDIRALEKVNDTLRRLEAVFGKTPADRASLKLPEQPDRSASDPFRKPKISLA